MGGGSADIQNGNHISYCMYNECTDSEMGDLNRKQNIVQLMCHMKLDYLFTCVHFRIKV